MKEEIGNILSLFSISITKEYLRGNSKLLLISQTFLYDIVTVATYRTYIFEGERDYGNKEYNIGTSDTKRNVAG